MASGENDQARETSAGTATDYETKMPNLLTVSWFRQFNWCIWKNSLLIMRRPVMLVFVLLSSVISVVVSWAAGGKGDPNDSIYPPQSAYTECGSLREDFFTDLDYWMHDKVRITLNEEWRDGVEVAIIGLGALANAIFVFIVISSEVQAQLLGVLRTLGLRDSVYWLSWYLVFVIVSVMNAILGAAMAKLLPGHVYESVFFLGIFASMLFLNLSLVSASIFMVALCGTSRQLCTNVCILSMIMAAFIPLIVQSLASSLPYGSDPNYFSPYPSGLFWQNSATTTTSNAYDFFDFSNGTNFTSLGSLCDVPIMNQDQGKWYKSELEARDVGNDEFFVGCYMKSSWSFKVWKRNSAAERFFMFFFPYFHFLNIWGGFVGYTAMPDRQFTSKEVFLSQEKLAIAALPRPPSPNSVTTMAPQGSMFVTDTHYDYSFDFTLSTCPLGNYSGIDLCPNFTTCSFAEDPGAQYGAPTVGDSIGLMFALSVFYLLLAAYWSSVFDKTNGKGERFYFFLLPSYWFSKNTEDINGREAGVIIEEVTKAYGNFEALKGVSFRMNPGEVTALLGHNGAGKTTLSNILCCEVAETTGEIRVFGYSVLNDSFHVRCMVGLCKQDDYLWPNLSAKEHLELFGGLRGVESAELDDIVQKWLKSVDLDSVQLQYASTYSGGMKRRLSVALATIGDRPLIVLDEPTTGMDPVSRRFVWRHIDSIKEGRVILLTTHAMEEADLLADEVAIMRKGKLAAFGSPLQLKSEHGTALQFSILVDKTRLEQAKNYVNNFFTDSHDCVDIQSSDAGTILVKIVALQDRIDGNGIRVETLTSFVAWLDDEKSPVSEYGFSNSSLEEVFLKVTEGDEEEGQEANDEATLTLENTVDFPDQADTFADVAHYTSNLSTWNQASVLLSGFYRRGWTGRGSVGNYCLFGILFIGSVLLLFGVSWNENPLPSLPVVIFFMSTFLLAIIGPIYADRSEGQFYLMKSQGLLPLGYIAGVSMYAFSAQFIYNLITLTGIFVSPFFWKSELCDYENDWENCYPGFGGRQQISNPLVVWNYNDEYQGMAVTLTAIRAPGGYGMVFGIIFSAAFAVVGQTLSTAFFPGYRLPLVMIMFITLVVSVLPAMLPVLLARADDDDEGYYKCRNITNPDFYCDGSFSRNNVSSEFVDCIGFQVNSFSQETFCVAPYAALLSHFGIYQMLAMAYTSKISFMSEPEGYVNDVLIPSLDGVKCNEDTCEFPFANRLYRLNFLYTIVGGVIFIIIGLQLAYIFAFPVGPILHFKQMIGRAYSDCRHQKKATTEEIEKAEELTEVAEERACVAEMISPLLDDEEPEYPSLTHSKIPRDGIAPVIMHRLRKVYPAFGGRLPKVALESLDLHVPKGEVLGLLGKNGAGKTTALKILAGAHDSSGGIGLVAGYDCGVEKISVFERLGNCAQFDVVWKGQSVQQHLEFFAALKGLPRNEIARVARATASAVGLGSDAVYRRNAGSLSGGMRRRLSIGMALIGSPSVVILDEPTTGLDPSTRSSIWSLITSFASHDRSMIITTHMMIEADTLCDRIAIVANGKLVVVGTQQHLKNRFGDGYVLQLNLVHNSPEQLARAIDFVQTRLHPDARLASRQIKTLQFNLPRTINREQVFKALYSEERTTEGCINQFLLSQSSLEDVFIALGDGRETIQQQV